MEQRFSGATEFNNRMTVVGRILAFAPSLISPNVSVPRAELLMKSVSVNNYQCAVYTQVKTSVEHDFYAAGVHLTGQ